MDSNIEKQSFSMITLEGLAQLFGALKADGFSLIGPTLNEQAVVYGEIASIDDLPRGWRDRQEPGRYRLERRGDESLFGFAVGPQSWKKHLFPAAQRLFQITRNGREMQTATDSVDSRKRALIGVRACELAALEILDRIFAGGDFVDPQYRSRRANVFIMAVNCTEPADTCFCTSMGTGPAVSRNFDLALTEITVEGGHEFLLHIGSEQGERLLERVAHRPATEQALARGREIMEASTRRMVRSMNASDVKDLIYHNYESTLWEEVAERCLSCGSCTMVCPTCFCTTVEDTTDLSGDRAERWRKWDSCFTSDFSYIVGGSVRVSTKARYRHWMTHKLAAWQDQFGMIGCVGCGRCITWCPVGIDITAETSALRDRTRITPKQEKKDGRQNLRLAETSTV